MPNSPHSPSRRSAPPASPPLALEAAAGGGLEALIERARWLERLDHLLRQSLPPAWPRRCRLANVDRNRLVFLVNAPAWKSKLRLNADALLDAAAAAGLTARTLVVKVVPASPISRVKPLANPFRKPSAIHCGRPPNPWATRNSGPNY